MQDTDKYLCECFYSREVVEGHSAFLAGATDTRRMELQDFVAYGADNLYKILRCMLPKHTQYGRWYRVYRVSVVKDNGSEVPVMECHREPNDLCGHFNDLHCLQAATLSNWYMWG